MRVLIAEDDPRMLRALVAHVSAWGYEITTAQNGAEAWALAQAAPGFDIAILDWVMPELDGLEVCRRVRALGPEPYVYVIMLTGKHTPADVIEGLEAGADDYVPKPFDRHELEVRLRAGKRIVLLQDELVRARDEMKHMAMHDPLTGAWSRAAVLDALARETARARRAGGDVGVVLFDIDHFKLVNDTFGHAAGDAVLVEVALRASQSVRPEDLFGRMGGEEFLLVLPGCQASQAALVAERVRRALRASPIYVEAGESVTVTASFGVTAAATAGAEGLELVRHADDALYRAKGTGRDRVAVANVTTDRDRARAQDAVPTPLPPSPSRPPKSG